MLAHIKLDLFDPCEGCEGTGKEMLGEKHVGPCPRCVSGLTLSADGWQVLNLVALFATPERLERARRDLAVRAHD